MGDIFKHIFEFIFFKTKSASYKFFYVFTILIILLLANDYFGVTKNIFINRKLQQLQRIKDLDPVAFEADSALKREITYVKHQIINKETFLEKAKRAIIAFFPKPLFTWRNFSASFFWIILMLAFLFTSFQSEHGFWRTIGILFLGEVWMVIMAILYIKMLLLIPDINPRWVNHVINYGVQILTSVLTIALIPSEKKKEEVVVNNV